MKRKILLICAALLLLAFSIAAFAYSRTSIGTTTAASCCCCSGDSCPLKKKDATGKETASCCDNCDCCKGDSCPMKMKGESADKKKEGASSETKNCDCSCCNKDKKDVAAV